MFQIGQNVWTDGQNGRTDDAKTISLRLLRGITIMVDGHPNDNLCQWFNFKSGQLYLTRFFQEFLMLTWVLGKLDPFLALCEQL